MLLPDRCSAGRRPRSASLPAATWLLALLIAVPGLARGAVFTPGDLCLMTNSTPLYGPAILRISPLSGATSLLLDLSDSPAFTGDLAWDPFRGKLLFTCYGIGGLCGLDANGNVSTVAATGWGPWTFTSRGDGIIYMWAHFGDGTDGFFYLDAAGTVHDLLDVPGTGRYALGGGRFVTTIIYHPATNSLVGLMGNHMTFMPSVCADGSQVCAFRIPLTTAGTQVSGAMVSTQFEVSPSFEAAVGLGYAPNDQILMTIDTNSNAQEPRMMLLDPATMTISVWAQNINAFSAATDAGTYSHVLGKAVIDDTGEDVLRAFAQGEISDGTIVADSVSSWGSAEFARLVEISSGGVVAVEAGGATPIARPLLSAAPNPFGGQTTLRYALAEPGRVTLAVRDIAGRAIRTLANGAWQAAGSQSATWDGRDDARRPVPPGCYTVTLSAGSLRASRTVLLVK